jgi:hypothetical protein
VKLAVAIVALLCILAAAIVGGLMRHAHIDTAGQGVLLLYEKPASECAGGGGCIAYSQREVRAIVQTAVQYGAQQGYEAGRGQCGRKDL